MVLAGFIALTQAFSYLYWKYGTTANFNMPLSRLDAVYFTLGTLTVEAYSGSCIEVQRYYG